MIISRERKAGNSEGGGRGKEVSPGRGGRRGSKEGGGEEDNRHGRNGTHFSGLEVKVYVGKTGKDYHCSNCCPLT